MDFFNALDELDRNEFDKQFEKITIKYKARNARKGVTTVHGLWEFGLEKKELENLIKKSKKSFNCGVCMKEAKGEKFVEIQGDRRVDISKTLTSEYNVPSQNIVVN